ncbi:hypothetical protein [Mycoplasmopsis fermentans]|uniref:hypothetical protein n=1 Tax=Mycoplasmopsis fermentans TaxID=2115 RepID=UPI0001E32F1E|nr:hypothetical protein [Mycoplasmopsis fermentans]ADN68692.1 hypothetical membrane spanning protein [Mycoplasmopsis fermentans JER]RMX36234.1 hypothetical protein MFI2_0064 [Mycoplasmopsis fermentans MF-I2]RMX36311.1 hypothetical protein MFI1_0051 [Mycoplasmopsis fermentans MF-I1]
MSEKGKKFKKKRTGMIIASLIFLFISIGLAGALFPIIHIVVTTKNSIGSIIAIIISAVFFIITIWFINFTIGTNYKVVNYKDKTIEVLVGVSYIELLVDGKTVDKLNVFKKRNASLSHNLDGDLIHVRIDGWVFYQVNIKINNELL